MIEPPVLGTDQDTVTLSLALTAVRTVGAEGAVIIPAVGMTDIGKEGRELPYALLAYTLKL
jgi:hypothetical protein